MRNPMKQCGVLGLIAATTLTLGGCERASSSNTATATEASALVGAWRSKITFQSGALAEMKGLEFMYSYNAGGTMTESSNYDEAANSTPPAYGIWKRIDDHTFQNKYLFYMTKSPTPEDHAPTSSDWWPAGHGVLTETITLAADGQSYTSTIKLVTYDKAGAEVPGGGEGKGAATRIAF